MLDRLPDELVLLIVEQLAPAPLVVNGYHKAQNTLRAHCLTARRYRRLVQPLLWRSLFFVDSTRYAKFVDLEGAHALRAHVRYLVVRPERNYGDDFTLAFNLGKVEPILPFLPNLVGLRLDGRHKEWSIDCFDPASLAMNHNLRLLQLAELKCTRILARFPQLEQLHMEDVTIKPDDITNSLDPALLPQLTALHIGDIYNPHDDQLDAAAPLHPREPSSLWLPRSVRAAAADSPDIQYALRDLGEACARAGRRLMWWEGELAEGELVSHEFWRYAREIKAARATGA
ncbi:hypothetical protein JCM10450v2_003294 [Rhodotorula kratochvilovae]